MSDVLPLTEPDLTVVSDDEYRFTWACGVDAIVEMMAEHSHEISAHVTWQTKAGRVSASRFNLGAARTRTEVANGLARRLPEFDWSGMVEQLCILTTDRWRQGEPSVDMRTFQPSTDGRWLLEPYVERADATVLFARGGSGKSMFALAVAVSIASGQEIVGRLHGASGPVLYLDWETGPQTFAERIRALCLSSGIPIPPIHYQHMVASLPEAASTLAREIRRTRSVFAVVDSLGMARGGEPESADLTLRTFKAGRGLGVPWLAVDHVTKAEGKDAQEPFGCHSDDTEVLTKRSWKTHSTVTLEDEVACFNLETQTFCWAKPTALHAYPFEGDLLQFKSRAVNALVTPNHRMIVRPTYKLPVGSQPPRRNPREWSFRNADEIGKFGGCAAFPYSAPFDDSGTETVSPAFARFLGWWLSEGTIDSGAPVLTQAEGPLAVRMRETVADLGYDANLWIGKTKSRPHEKDCMQLRLRSAIPLGTWLTDHCGDHAWNKRIPEFAWSWDQSSRFALFQSLMEGDGHWRKPGTGNYTTTSDALADGVQALAIGLGFSGKVVRRENHEWRPTYVVYIGGRRGVWTPPSTKVFYRGMVYCLTVPTGAYLTRRQGTQAVTGNSAYTRNAARLMWSLTRAQSTGDIALRLRKANNGPDGLQVAYKVTVSKDEGDRIGGIVYESLDLGKSSFSDRLPLTKRIIEILLHNSMTREELIEATGDPPQNVRKRVWEMVQARVLTEMPDKALRVVTRDN